MNILNEFLTIIKYLDPISYIINWNSIKDIRLIGKGSCGNVHEISIDDSSKHYAMKIIPIY